MAQLHALGSHSKVTYLCIAKHTCPTTGAPYLQCYIHWTGQRSYSATQKDLPPGCNIGPRWSADRLAEYHRRDTSSKWEYGVRPARRNRAGEDAADHARAKDTIQLESNASSITERLVATLEHATSTANEDKKAEAIAVRTAERVFERLKVLIQTTRDTQAKPAAEDVMNQIAERVADQVTERVAERLKAMFQPPMKALTASMDELRVVFNGSERMAAPEATLAELKAMNARLLDIIALAPARRPRTAPPG